MKLPFTKMHGAGNDYIYIDGFNYKINKPDNLAIKLSDRHFGIGADGIVIIHPSTVADCRMQMFNADGSEGMMCGNAIRCVGKWMFEHKQIEKEHLTVETLSGIKTLQLNIEQNKVVSASVDMGKVSFKCSDIPVDIMMNEMVEQYLMVDNNEYQFTALSVGNPHAVIFKYNIEEIELEKIGPKFEHHPIFPQRINTEFVEIINKNEIKMRVWERGSGETWACGTGACAAVAAAIKSNRLQADTPITVHLKGGDLVIKVDKEWNVNMLGNAVEVFEGEIEIYND